MPLNFELTVEEARLAISAAATLKEYGPEFAEQVEVALVSGKMPERHTFADPLSVISVLIAAASLVWSIWKDMQAKQTQPPDKSEVIKAALDAMKESNVSEDSKVRIVTALVEKL